MSQTELPSRRLRQQIRDSITSIHQAYDQQLYLEMDNDPTPVGFRRTREKAMLSCISSGDLDRIETYLLPAIRFLEEPQADILNTLWSDFSVGMLAERPLQQMLYLFIGHITLCTRAALEGGLPEQQAYSLSDCYIRYGTQLTDITRLGLLSSYAMYDFTRAVAHHRFRDMSQITRICCEYIQKHLHDRITMADLSREADRSANYISDLFARETGERPMKYIRSRKLEYARRILEFTDLTIESVSDLLAFPSTSSFITHFKQAYGVSPGQWRNAHL